jgi:hypothetical protein
MHGDIFIEEWLQKEVPQVRGLVHDVRYGQERAVGKPYMQGLL